MQAVQEFLAAVLSGSAISDSRGQASWPPEPLSWRSEAFCALADVSNRGELSRFPASPVPGLRLAPAFWYSDAPYFDWTEDPYVAGIFRVVET